MATGHSKHFPSIDKQKMARHRDRCGPVVLGVTACHVVLWDSFRNCSSTIGIADAYIARNVDGGVGIC